MVRKLAILGLGLMGGSLGLAARRRGLARTVTGYARRAQTRRLALRRGVVDEVFDRPEDAVRDADLVVICLPVLTIVDTIRRCREAFAPGCIVTDVGSTKRTIVREARRALGRRPVVFIGSHPMAGKELAGLEAADEQLYNGATVILTPASRQGGGLARLERLWRQLGSRVERLSPVEHDRLVGRVSHLPHLVATALVQVAARGRVDELTRFCGGGFFDSTRIAAGSEHIWHDIVLTNRAPVGAELRRMIRALQRLATLVEKGRFAEIRRILGAARARRSEMERRRS